MGVFAEEYPGEEPSLVIVEDDAEYPDTDDPEDEAEYETLGEEPGDSCDYGAGTPENDITDDEIECDYDGDSYCDYENEESEEGYSQYGEEDDAGECEVEYLCPEDDCECVEYEYDEDEKDEDALTPDIAFPPGGVPPPRCGRCS
jgi:hypothetical protein